MSQIIFDGFDPDSSCFSTPPTSATLQDPCTIQVTYHIQGDTTPKDPTISFRRSHDNFTLETHFRENEIGLLKSAGFSENSPLLQSSLFYSIALNRWMGDNYPGFVKENNYKGVDLLPLGKKVLNFILAGSIEKPDADQVTRAASTLKEILSLSEDGRIFFTNIVDILKKDKTGVIRKEVEPRTTWLLNLLTEYGTLLTGFPELKATDPLKDPLQKSTISLLVYLGIGEGKMEDVMAGIDALSPQLLSRKDIPENFRDYYQFLGLHLSEIQNFDYFQKDAGAKERMQIAAAALKAAVDEHHAELLSMKPEMAFRRSLELKLIDAGMSDSLIDLVKDEVKSAKLSSMWMHREGNLQEISDAILPNLKWTPDPKGPGTVALDVKGLESSLSHLINSHGIQQREFMIGELAALRFFFGKTLGAVEMKVWVKNKYTSIPLKIAEGDRKTLAEVGKRLEKNISRSLRETSIYLPIGEAGLGGLGLLGGTLGLHEDNRALSVTGFTSAGVGIGSLITHYAYPTRNPYISDAVGGAIGGVIAFGISFFLVGKNGDMGNPGRNPTGGFGP
jgi:hypothetical protein